MPVASCRRVSKAYGGHAALTDITLEVREGEIFGLLGPNGAGKTTLIRILLDVLRPDTGEVLLFGSAPSRAAIARVGYLPEERGLYRRPKTRSVLEYLARLRGLPRRTARLEASRWLARVGLASAADLRVEQLSKGMAQKAQLATALLGDPELCILDEPFSGLDPVNVQLVHELIVERRQRGFTTILSTHQMNKVEDLCSRVAIIHEGRLRLYGATEELRRTHSRERVRVRVVKPPTAWPPGLHVEQEDARTVRLDVPEGRTPDTVLAELVAHAIAVECFEPIVAPMEEVFVRAVTEPRSHP